MNKFEFYRKRQYFKEKFKKIFNIDFMKFFEPITGFDIIEFGDYIGYKIDSEKSLKDYVEENWGEEGVFLVKEVFDFSLLNYFEEKSSK